MKNQWLVWAFIAGVIVVVIIAFNSENQQKFRLGEAPAEVQYEDMTVAQEPAGVVPAAKADAPVKQETYIPAQATAEPADDVGKISVQASAGTPEVSSATYAIQIFSIRELKDAQRGLADVVKKGYAGYIVQRDLGEKGIWYRIYVGQFAAKAEADAYLAKVKKDFPSAFVIAPKK